jgi:lysophospholipase L1-like esterase
MFGRVKDAALIVGITAALYASVDLTVGALYPMKPYELHAERRTSPAYAGESYFSEEFLIESFTQPDYWHTPKGTTLVLPSEFHGRYINVDILEPTRLPYRRTLNVTQSHDSKIVLILGGSTVYNSEVPDEFTVASLLSKVLNVGTQSRYFVLNAGVTSVNTTQELERLRIELKNGLHPKVVVSFSGINDVSQGVYFGNPDGVMFSYAQRSAVKEFVKRVVPLNIYRMLIMKAARENQRTIPEHLLDRQKVIGFAERVERVYFENMLVMQNLAKEHNFVFVALLQPYLLSATYPVGQNEMEEVSIAEGKTLPNIHIAFDLGYKALKRSIRDLQMQGVSAYDVTDIFAGKASSMFLDWAHVNSVGNKLIAERMAEIILRSEVEQVRPFLEKDRAGSSIDRHSVH